MEMNVCIDAIWLQRIMYADSSPLMKYKNLSNAKFLFEDVQSFFFLPFFSFVLSIALPSLSCCHCLLKSPIYIRIATESLINSPL